MKAALLDIEGTTTRVSFVHDVLFPYSFEHMDTFLEKNQNSVEIKAALEEVSKELKKSIALSDLSQTLKKWIKDDVKHPQLKKIQGMIWKSGYESGELKSHIYEDVIPALKSWKENGISLSIYSSGSIEAQKLLFSHTEKGDLTPLFDNYFDLSTGSKKDMASFQKIAQKINIAPEEIVFLSDIEEELTAAAQAKFLVFQVLREGTLATEKFPIIESFNELEGLV